MVPILTVRVIPGTYTIPKRALIECTGVLRTHAYQFSASVFSMIIMAEGRRKCATWYVSKLNVIFSGGSLSLDQVRFPNNTRRSVILNG